MNACCVDHILNHKDALNKWSDSIDKFINDAASLEKFKLFRGDGCFAFDKSKIVISTADTSVSGYELMRILREKYSIELEAAGEKFALAMTGIFDDESSLGALFSALADIEKNVARKKCGAALNCAVPPYAMTIKEAVGLKAAAVPRSDAVGRVSAEYIYSYPPGVPLIVPGEIFTENVISFAEDMQKLGAKVVANDKMLKTFRVIEK